MAKPQCGKGGRDSTGSWRYPRLEGICFGPASNKLYQPNQVTYTCGTGFFLSIPVASRIYCERQIREPSEAVTRSPHAGAMALIRWLLEADATAAPRCPLIPDPFSMFPHHRAPASWPQLKRQALINTVCFQWARHADGWWGYAGDRHGSNRIELMVHHRNQNALVEE